MHRTADFTPDNYETLTQNFRLRIAQFAQTLEQEHSGITMTPRSKLIALHEYILCLLHLIDRTAYELHLVGNIRGDLRNYLIRDLLEDQILPMRLSKKLCDDGYHPNFASLGLTPQTGAEVLLPFWRSEVNNADKYYASSIEMVGKFPEDERGLLNKLCIRIANSVRFEGGTWNILNDVFILDVAVNVTFDDNLSRSDSQAFHALSENQGTY